MKTLNKFFRASLSLVLSASMTAAPLSSSQFLSSGADNEGVTEFFVSPDGNDSGSGTYDSPFQTLEAARDAVRKINKDMSGDIKVYLRGGDYRLTQPVVFDTKDSGTNGHTISY